MRIESLMRHNPPSVAPAAPVATVIALLLDEGLHSVPVVDAEAAVVGMVSSADLIHRAADERFEQPDSLWRESFYKSDLGGAGRDRAQGRTAEAVMTPRPVTVAPQEDMAVAARALIDGGYNALPVVAEGRLVGLITRLDLLRCLRDDPDCCNPVKRTD